MTTFKGVIFANKAAFDGVQTAVWNYLKAKEKKLDLNVVKAWSKGIDSTDDSKVLMPIDKRVEDYPWNPHAIVDIDTNDPKWFPNTEINE